LPAARDLHPGASPAHFFGAEVRRAREAAGMTLADLGAVVPCDASTVSRIESGLLNPTERFSHACDESFAQMGGWFTRFYNDSRRWDGPYPRWFADWVDAEGRATVVLVTARIDRQRIFDRPKPPSLWAVLDEGVLRRSIGGAKVMHDQLVHLAELAERPTVRIHIVPAEVGAHIGLLGAFAIAGFTDDVPGTVYFESPDQGETTQDPTTVASMILTFDTLRSEALPRGASRDLIMRVAEEIWT